MVRYIRFLPAEKTVPAARGKSLLQIGLSAGLELPYNCSNGNCGECWGYIRQGQTRQFRHSDFVETAGQGTSPSEEQNRSQILLCCHEPDWDGDAEDLIVEINERGQEADVVLRTLTLTLNRIEKAGEDHRLLFCKTPRNQGLKFYAGQQAELSIPGTGFFLRLPIASCPCDGRFLEFHVERETGNAFSEAVFNQLRRRSTIQLTGPFGDFRFMSEDSDRPLVFVAYENGFASVNSLLEHAQTLELESPQTLFRFSRNGTEPYRANLCHAWEDAFDYFSYVECQESILDNSDLRRACLTMADFLSHPLQEAEFYLAMPAAMCIVLQEFLLEQGVAEKQVHILLH